MNGCCSAALANQFHEHSCSLKLLSVLVHVLPPKKHENQFKHEVYRSTIRRARGLSRILRRRAIRRGLAPSAVLVVFAVAPSAVLFAALSDSTAATLCAVPAEPPFVPFAVVPSAVLVVFTVF
jgi:hypothetical protein